MNRIARLADPRMLTATFLHANGIGASTETKLWEAGVLHWEQCAGSRPDAVSKRRWDSVQATAEQSIAALESRDHRWFARHIPSPEHWRLLPWFANRMLFVDIETNGGYEPDDITIIGLYDGFESRILVQGRDIDDFPALVAETELLVTFFGGGFDLPFLRRRFPHLPLDQPHVDLCPTLRRLGMRGGLKAIEGKLGIWRDETVDGLGGMDAVRLWNRWRYQNDAQSLELLIRYNREDIVNLEGLLEWALPRLVGLTGFPSR